MSSRTQYVAVETMISMAINTALSIGFVFLIFHGQPRVYATGLRGIAFDMAPQTFMIGLMSCLVPGLLTRSRIASGRLTWHQQANESLVAHVWFRAVVLALVATCLVAGVSWIVLPRIIPMGIDFRSLLVGKALFGMILAAFVTPWAIARVLR